MSKAGKRGKSGDVKGGPAGGGKWDQVLSSSSFQEESWNPCVTWIVGRQAEDSKHIEALNVIVQAGTRKLFSVVTKELLLADVRELGNPKNKKAKEIPANSEVCEACKPYVDSGEAIPVPLLAKLIKWKLMAIKTADLKRREVEAKAAAEKKKGAKDAKDATKERAKSPKKGGKKTPEPQTAKDGSKLRKRGEEDSDNKYIDDEPEDGSDHYILITGFHDPRLFQFLEEIKVSVDSVIGVSSQDYMPLKRPVQEGEPPAEPTEEDKKYEELQKELRVFWTDLLPLLQRLPDASSLHDIARLDYEVKALMVPTDPLDAEMKITATEEGKEPPSEQAPPSRPDGLNFHLASYLTSVAFKLGLSESEHQVLSEVLELPPPPPEEPSPPELINVQDDISNRTQHLQPHYGFDAAAVERVMLQFLPFAQLCRMQQRPTSAESRLRAARLQELIHHCARENLSKSGDISFLLAQGLCHTVKSISPIQKRPNLAKSSIKHLKM
ncbi:sperm-associated antigen 17 [Plakobranchus ocellatus]|uniref:Sperm-associated antigen 17 n=1 Tax=Plakobranchus ocellatus TaxID=259542 RepID=A0AAV4A3E4_9GAST|nr:sperm-associated antigen 17 [Plakobranchus ocellatus]